MMTARSLGLLVLVTGFLTACATFSKSSERNLYQVHLGQSKAELIDAIGKPAKVDVDGTEEHWHYTIYSYNERGTYPYTAVFEGDKLMKWDFDTSTVQKQREEDLNMRRPSSSKF